MGDQEEVAVAKVEVARMNLHPSLMALVAPGVEVAKAMMQAIWIHLQNPCPQ